MKFKSLIAAIVCGVAIFTSSVCYATISSSRISVGGMYPGMNVNDLLYRFGEPNERQGAKWIYPYFHAVVNYNVVVRISTHSDRYEAPGGVHCGSTLEKLARIYGRSDDARFDGDTQDFIYYSNDYRTRIEFIVNRHDVVSKIICQVD